MALLFIIVFICLGLTWLSGHFTVRYAVQMAYLFNVSPVFIAFSVLSFGTGLPELMIALHAIIIGKPIVSAADIIGSNFIDVALILGIPALFISPIISRKQDNAQHIALILIATLLMSSLFIVKKLNFVVGIMLILVYAISLVFFWRTRHIEKFIPSEELASITDKPTNSYMKVITSVKLLLSLASLMIVARLSVQSALAIADILGISAGIIGATVVAIGTSLPELSLTCTSVYNKEYSLAISSALGSVLEQGSLILGILALFSRQTIDLQPIITMAPFLLIAYALTAFCVIWSKRISRIVGLLLIGTFISYLYVVMYG